MLSFSKGKNGVPIAINKDGDIVYVDSIDSDLEKNDISAKNLSILPNYNSTQREILYIAAPSGSGKSTIASKYAEFYRKLHPKQDIYLFSKVENDPAFKNVKRLYTIKANESLLEDGIDTKELSNSLVIYDDVDTVPNKDLYKMLTANIIDILETGRHRNTSVIITSHLINGNDRAKTKSIMNESHKIVIYPKTTSWHSIKYFLKNYIGIDDKDVYDYVKNLKSRWVCIHKNHPQYILHENGAMII